MMETTKRFAVRKRRHWRPQTEETQKLQVVYKSTNLSTLETTTTIKETQDDLISLELLKNRRMSNIDTRIETKRANSTTMSNLIGKKSLQLFLALLAACLLAKPTTSQRQPQMNDPPPSNLIGNQYMDTQAEPRAELGTGKPPADALNQLIGLINNYANQQSQNQNRRLPLPLNTQRQMPQQQQPTAQVSTPNPAQFIGPQFQSTRQRINFPLSNQQNNINNNNQQLFPASSPPTPYLTLSRIANYGQQANNNGQQNRQSFNVQPINTIPLGAASNMNNPSSGRQSLIGVNQQRGQQFNPSQIQQFGSQPSRPPSTVLPPLPTLAQNPMKPMSGFAPSGPPPSQSTNKAMVVVPSPPNAIGQVNTQNQMSTSSPASQEEKPSTSGDRASDLFSSETLVEDRPTTLVALVSDKPTSESTVSSTTMTLSTTTTVAAPQTGTELDGNQTSEVGKTKISDWNPLETNRTKNDKPIRTQLAPSPDIVTVPPGYNPDNPNNQPQNYDISVSAQMGPSANQSPPRPVLLNPNSFKVVNSTEASNDSLSASTSSTLSVIAPTAVTTIIWSPPPTEAPSTPAATAIETNKPFSNEAKVQITESSYQPTRIRDNSMNEEQSLPKPIEDATGVVYGKPQNKNSKPPAPNQISASSESGSTNTDSLVKTSGQPFIKPAQMDNQVRPFTGGTLTQQQQQNPLRSNHLGSSSSHPFGRPSRPLNGNQSPMSVNSAFTITAAGNQTMPTGDIQDYIAGQPPLVVPSSSQTSGSFQVNGGEGQELTISAQGGQDPADSSDGSSGKSSPDQASSHIVTSSTSAPTRVRRPTFKPKPAIPPIRIDSCIVGDDSSCDQSHNERCVTEYGISSCHCKPGFARLSQLRGYCGPISSLQLNMKIDKLSDDRKLVFNQTLDNSNTEEYQYLEFETIQALASAFQQTSLAKQFMGARVNKFFERKGKVWVNVSVNFELNNITKAQDKIQNLAAQELLKVAQNKQKPLGDSTVMLDGSREALSKLVDINECANKDLNDCSKHATCINDFGGFQCQCLPGYEDKYQSEENSKHGRVCVGCSPSYCSNRGECSIQDGQKQCKCRANFMGSRCDIDSEVLAVAVGGSLVGVIILIITFWCLFVFNRRWKREQQKMDAMSATSGLTYNYVNSSTNSLMSPRMIGGLHRSGGHQVGAMASNYGQRFGAALTGGVRGGYATDQQAIIGSTSSGSSAASQPIGCNPYAPVYQYEDGGLLIAPASNGSSEQTSPSGNSYRGMVNGGQNAMLSQMVGSAYTLSGHHHHHHPHLHHHHANKSHQTQMTQFHPSADYRTINNALHCPSSNYDARWRTLQQHDSKQALGGYYLSSDMLVGQQPNTQQQQQLYASAQRELCIDTGGNNLNKVRKQAGRNTSNMGMSSRRVNNSHNVNRSSYYAQEYDNERPI